MVLLQPCFPISMKACQTGSTFSRRTPGRLGQNTQISFALLSRRELLYGTLESPFMQCHFLLLLALRIDNLRHCLSPRCQAIWLELFQGLVRLSTVPGLTSLVCGDRSAAALFAAAAFLASSSFCSFLSFVFAAACSKYEARVNDTRIRQQ